MTSLKIYYGPYEAHGIIKHRIQRIRGLLQYLEENHYETEVIKVNLINRLAIEMCERQIFVADIKNFKFNMDWEDDAVCQKAIYAITEAQSRMMFDNKSNLKKDTSSNMTERKTLISFASDAALRETAVPETEERSENLWNIPEVNETLEVPVLLPNNPEEKDTSNDEAVQENERHNLNFSEIPQVYDILSDKGSSLTNSEDNDFSDGDQEVGRFDHDTTTVDHEDNYTSLS